jgi:predicted DNA-binding ribbon-helix-helix protein
VSTVKPVKRSFSIAGHRTSISLETPFWEALNELADAAGLSLAQYVADIDSHRGRTNLSSAVRVHILAHYREQQPQDRQT